MLKVIVAGSRTFNNYPLLARVLDHMLKNHAPNVEIVSGGCSGADLMGERYAREKGYPVKQFLPDWKLFNKAAGPVRNWEMADYGDALVAFWDGNSRGTKSMIEAAREHGKRVKIVDNFL